MSVVKCDWRKQQTFAAFMTFNTLSQTLIDTWLSHDDPSPEVLSRSAAGQLSVRARVSVIELTGDNAEDWVLLPLRQSRIIQRLIDLNSVFGAGRLGDIADQDFVRSAVLPQYRSVIESGQPSIDQVNARLLGLRVVYDRIILPQKTTGRPTWLLTCTWGRFMIRLPDQVPVLDDTDQTICLLLIDGASAKEIAAELNLSSRTVEHRIERLKKQTGARNTTNLIALISAAGAQGGLKYLSDSRA